jgi:hypothetical protein
MENTKIHCPKCGNICDQCDADGAPILTCPSCEVYWAKFLESMANDALWPDIVKRLKHDLYCPACGYERVEADESIPRTECPKCKVIYTNSLLGKINVQPSRPPVSEQNSWVNQEKNETALNKDTLDISTATSVIKNNLIASAHKKTQTSKINGYENMPSIIQRNNFIVELRNNSLYPAFRFITKVNAYFGYLISGFMLVVGLVGLTRDWRWQVVLGLIVTSALIAIVSKAGAEFFQIFADAADTIVLSGGRHERDS